MTISTLGAAVLMLGLVLPTCLWAQSRPSTTQAAGKQTYDGKPADLDIYILIGQSNMSGRAKIEKQDKLPIPRFYLADASNEFIPAVHPLNAFSTIRKGLGGQRLNLGAAFAGAMLKKMPKGKSIGLLVQARGGSRIESWAKGQRYYRELLKRITAVKTRGRIRGILWHQGENNFGQMGYLEKLTKLIADLRTDLAAPTLPFIVGQIRQDGDELHVTNKQLAEVPKQVKHTACVSAKGLKTTDRWHFDSASIRQLGRRYAKVLQKQLSPKPKPEKVHEDRSSLR